MVNKERIMLEKEPNPPQGQKGLIKQRVLEILREQGRIPGYSALGWLTGDDNFAIREILSELEEEGLIMRKKRPDLLTSIWVPVYPVSLDSPKVENEGSVSVVIDGCNLLDLMRARGYTGPGDQKAIMDYLDQALLSHQKAL
jgi:hypothetical protein